MRIDTVPAFELERSTSPPQRASLRNSDFRSILTARQAAHESKADAPPIHTVCKGENLSSIVNRFLRGSGLSPSNPALYEAVGEVARANGLANPDLIFPGQEINLAALAKAEAPPQPDLNAPRIVSAPQPPGRASVSRAATKEPLLPNAPGRGPSQAPPQFGHTSQATPAAVASIHVHKTPLLAPTPTQPGQREGVSLSAQGRIGITELSGAKNSANNARVDLPTLVREILQIDPERDLITESPWEMIVKGRARLTSGFGLRRDPFSGLPQQHEGVDLAAKTGAPVRPYRAGLVTFSGWKQGYGNTVILKHANGLESVYGHNAKNSVLAGDRVDAGTVIGQVGSSGRSTGPHLHFEIREQGKAVNPIPYLIRGQMQLAKQ